MVVGFIRMLGIYDCKRSGPMYQVRQAKFLITKVGSLKLTDWHLPLMEASSDSHYTCIYCPIYTSSCCQELNCDLLRADVAIFAPEYTCLILSIKAGITWWLSIELFNHRR